MSHNSSLFGPVWPRLMSHALQHAGFLGTQGGTLMWQMGYPPKLLEYHAAVRREATTATYERTSIRAYDRARAVLNRTAV